MPGHPENVPETSERQMRKHGPTPRDPSELRTVRFNLMLTESEYVSLVALCGSTSRKRVSEYVRRSIFDRESGKIPEANLTVWRELAPVFSNLNQIAKRVNAFGRSDTLSLSIRDMRDTIKSLRAELLG